MAIPTDGNLSILIPFDLIINTEYGLIQYIRAEYSDNDIWNQQAISLLDEESIIIDLLDRAEKNPLFIIANDYNNDKESLDNLYIEFMNKTYKDILSYSNKTKLYNAIVVWVDMSQTISITILCKNKLEIDYIKSLPKFKKCNVIMDTKPLSEINLSNYNTIYIKDADDLIDTKIRGKNIYIAAYLYNLEYTDNIDNGNNIVPKINNIKHLLGTNEIKIFSMYKEGDN